MRARPVRLAPRCQALSSGTDMKRKRIRVKPLTARAIAAMKRAHHTSQTRDRETQRMLNAIRQSTQITGDDLKVIVR